MARTLTSCFGSLLLFCSAQAQNIVGYEYWFDQNDTARIYVPVAPNTTVDLQNAQLNTNGLSLGQHQACLRWKDQPVAGQARWSSVVCRTFQVGQSGPWGIVAVRYWISTPVNDADPLIRYKYFDTPQDTINYNGLLDLCGFDGGSQMLKLQLLDNHGQWSSVVTRNVSIAATTPMGITSITPSISPFCTGQQVTFTANPVTSNNAALPTSFAWTLPPGWTTLIAGGDSVVVIIGDSPGTISVVGSNYCNQSASGNLFVADVECPDMDCLGVLGGTALPNTPCDDGNALTQNDTWSLGCICQGYDCQGVVGGAALPGTPCNDGDPLTEDDTWAANCQCIGTPLPVDCEGVVGGPALPGTPCNNGAPGIWSSSCQCVTGSGGEYYAYEPSVTTCQGAFLDSGGNGGGYGNNESFTTVICPDGAGPSLSLQWIIFNLSTAGIAPHDQLRMYDGVNTSAPLLGAWSGSDNPGIISAGFANVTGCLTVVFTSNESGTGDFAAVITCFQPCEPPVASATFGGASPLLACQGESITFDASASTAASGFSLAAYHWSFGDGSVDSTSGAIVMHSFQDPAEYVVQVVVLDDNDCASINPIDLVVQVGTVPSFAGTTPSQVLCLGDSLELSAVFNATPWGALPLATSEVGILLPDLQGVPFSSVITVAVAANGQTVEDPTDIEAICINMEHSYMGDLVVQLTCPNGQSMTLHQQGGGGTYLGVPVDDESDTPGTCWNYCWSPTANNGTWVDNSGGTLATGTYESVQPFSNLIGCPVNGNWTFTVTDLFAIDNGYLCDWSIQFASDIGSGFTPVLGAMADSCGWTGSGFVPDADDPWAGTASPFASGNNNYTFNITDNFGCTYDTTITLFVPDLQINSINGPANPTAGSVAIYTVDPVLNDVDSIQWSSLPTGWSWSDTDTIDGEAAINVPAILVPFTLCAQAYGFGCAGNLECLSIGGVGLDEVAGSQQGLVIYPNPNNGTFTVGGSALTGIIEGRLLDALGRQVAAFRVGDRSAVVELDDLPSGTYVLQWTTPIGIGSRPFVVAR